MTGGHLIKFLEEGESAMTTIEAFIQCLKYDDGTNNNHGLRMIIPPQNLTGDGIVQRIMIELASGKANTTKGPSTIMQRYLACPVFYPREQLVLFVDTNTKDQIQVLHSKDTGMSSEQIQESGKTFAVQADKAFVQCGYTSPFPNQDKTRVAGVCFDSSSKQIV